MKLGFIIDSSAGITEKKAKTLNLMYLPLFLSIDNKEYADGVDINPKKYFSIINKNQNNRTSATPPAIVLKTFKEASEKYDHVIVYPISSELSSQTSNLKALSNEFKNVHVINSKLLGEPIIEEIKDLKKLNNQRKNIDKIISHANKETSKWTGILIPKTLEWLVKGGRVKPAVASMANLLKIIPMIRFKNGFLDKEGKGRVFSKTSFKASKILNKETGDDNFYILKGSSIDMNVIVDKVLKEFPKTKVSWLPPVVANHTGPETFGIMIKKEK